MDGEEALARLRRLGLVEQDARALFAHFADAERRGKPGHGFVRVEWLESVRFDASARARRLASEPGFERWDGQGALGYLVLEEVVHAQLEEPPSRARVVVVERCFPTGVLGYWTRRLAEAGLVSLLTATSPPRLAHPVGGPPLVGTNPLSLGLPNPDGPPVIVDVSMGKVTHGDVLRGVASADELVPFGGEHAHKAFALAVGLQGFVESLAGDDYGAVLVVARPAHDRFVAALRERAGGIRLPGDA